MRWPISAQRGMLRLDLRAHRNLTCGTTRGDSFESRLEGERVMDRDDLPPSSERCRVYRFADHVIRHSRKWSKRRQNC